MWSTPFQSGLDAALTARQLVYCNTLQMMLDVPPKATPDTDSGYFEELTKAIFRSWFSWRVVRQKWGSFHDSFDGFDLDGEAGFGAEDIDQLFDDKGIIRNRRKILATLENASTMLDLIAVHGAFHGYMRSLDSLDYYGRVAALNTRFS